MFRWLTDQYPDIVHRQLESDGLDENLVVDNLYLDMNGIIHPCTHGNSDARIVLDETAMFKKIFLYVDRYEQHKSSSLFLTQNIF
jgi:5'-3' exoribonuclease 1